MATDAVPICYMLGLKCLLFQCILINSRCLLIDLKDNQKILVHCVAVDITLLPTTLEEGPGNGFV